MTSMATRSNGPSIGIGVSRGFTDIRPLCSADKVGFAPSHDIVPHFQPTIVTTDPKLNFSFTEMATKLSTVNCVE